MYDRILQILLESSAARRAATRAKIAAAIARDGDAADRLYNQKPDPLAQRAAVAAKKAKAQRVQKQGQSQSAVHVAGSRKDAREAGQELIGTTGRSGGKLPRVAPTAAKPETDQRALVPVPSTRALVPVPSTRAVVPASTRAVVPASRTTRDVVPVGPEIQGQGNRKPIKPRDPGVEDAEFTVKPDRMPFSSGYRKFLRGAEAALSTRNRLRMPDTSIVRNAFSIGSRSSNAPVTPGGRPTRQTRKDREARGGAVRSVLGALTGRKSMHSPPPYKP